MNNGWNPYLNSAAASMQQTFSADVNNMASASFNAISRMPGYYCIECGNYIDRSYNDVRCPYCGSEIIGADYVKDSFNGFAKYGLLGGIIHSVDSNSNRNHAFTMNRIRTYYASDLFEQNHIRFEDIVYDRGLVGEYMVSREIEGIKNAFRNLRFHVLYNLFVPEPNGSFAEIDAVIIVGRFIYLIEAKNRAGMFAFNHASDQKWTHILNNSREDILSPLIQNENHIDILDHYLEIKAPGTDRYYYNYVALGYSSDFSLNASNDEFDNLILRTWGICNTQRLGEFISDSINSLFSAIRTNGSTPEEAVKDGLLSEKKAQDILNVLTPLTNISQAQKDVLMHNREMTGSSRHRYPWQYFYILENGYAYLLRYNREFVQVLNETSEWVYYSDLVISNDGLPLVKLDGENIQLDGYLLRTPLELVTAYHNKTSGIIYAGDERNRIHKEHHSSYNREQTDSQSEVYIFFSGCDSMEKLNARYRILAKAFHPDGSAGDEDSFKKMQDEYDRIKKKFQ